MGEKAERMILADFKVLPQKLELSGYKFLYPTLEPALRHLLGKHR
jgi:NAD dependent epimerase/dehydratase family enzyme